MQKLNIILAYTRYLLFAKTKNTIHSPFLYHLITNVFEDSTKFPEYRKVEGLLKSLRSDERVISVHDFGAGSQMLTGQSRSVKDIARTSSNSSKYGQLLFRLTNYFKPQTILELGTSVGLGSVWLALGNPSARVYTIEGCSETASIASENFRRLNLDNVSLINGTFDTELPKLLDSLEEIHFVFIDGNHRLKPTISYFEQCLSKSVNETCFVIDDIHWSEEMTQAWKEIIDNKKVSMTVDLFFFGLVFVNQGLSKQDLTVRF